LDDQNDEVRGFSVEEDEEVDDEIDENCESGNINRSLGRMFVATTSGYSLFFTPVKRIDIFLQSQGFLRPNINENESEDDEENKDFELETGPTKNKDQPKEKQIQEEYEELEPPPIEEEVNAGKFQSVPYVVGAHNTLNI
jgi:hypothetical protein